MIVKWGSGAHEEQERLENLSLHAMMTVWTVAQS